jgi:pyrophosphatase PpaX
MKHIQALLFDLDDTLALRSTLAMPAYTFIAERFNLKKEMLSDPCFRSGTLQQAFALLGVTPDIHDAVWDENLKFQVDNLHLLQEVSGAKRSLAYLKTRFKIGVVSNRRENGRDFLKQCGHHDYVDVYIGAEHVTNPKPHPEGILKALEALNVQKENAVYIGDSHLDVETARNAGIPAIIIGSPDCSISLRLLEDSQPEYRVASHDELVQLFK